MIEPRHPLGKARRSSLGFFVTLCVVVKAAAAAAGAFEPAAFFAKFDLERPELEAVRNEVEAGRFDAALSTWRDLVVARLRRRDFGRFGWHGYALHPRPCGGVDMLAGKTSRKTYLQKPPDQILFIDIFGMSGSPGSSAPVNWHVDVRDVDDWGSPALAALPLRRKLAKTNYTGFETMKSFVAQYWRTEDPAYRDKLFHLMADFSSRHYHEFWNDYRRNFFHDDAVRHKYRADWRLNTNGLGCAWRLKNFHRLMAGTVKCLGDDKPQTWDAVLAPRTSPLSRKQRSCIHPVQLARIAESAVFQHAPKLMWFCREGSVPNQRTSALTALAWTSVIFRDFNVIPQLKNTLERQLRSLLSGNYLPDGGSLEQSFNYNHGELDALETLVEFYGERTPPFLSRVKAIISARRAVDDGLQTPLGGLPQVGNHHAVLGKDIWSSADAEAFYWKSDKVRGKASLHPQAYTSKAFPYSGYYAMRSGWTTRDLYLFLMNGRPQRGHSMRDNLAIQVTAYGRQLLVCGGSPTYNRFHTPDAEGADFYLSEASSLKCNTVLLDGMSQARNGPVATRAPQTPVQSRWHSSDRFDYADGVYDLGYVANEPGAKPDMSVAHERVVVFVKPAQLWVVLDRMHAAEEGVKAESESGKPPVATPSPPPATRSFTQIWNFLPRVDGPWHKRVAGFMPEHVFAAAGKRRCGTADPDGPNIDLHHFGPARITYDKYYGDRENWLGWYARGIGDAIPAVDIHATWRSDDSDTLLTLLVPRDKDDGGPITETVSRDRPAAGIAGVDCNLQNGALLGVRATSRVQHLQVSGVSANAELLVIHRDERRLSGIVHGARRVQLPGGETLTCGSASFEFVAPRNGKRRTTPISVPDERLLPPAHDVDVPTAREPDLPSRNGLRPGLNWRYADYEGGIRLFDLMKRAEFAPAETGAAPSYAPAPWEGKQRFGLLFNGYLAVPEDGVYTFHVSSPQGAAVFLRNPGRELMGPPLVGVSYRNRQNRGEIRLRKGLHCLRIEYQHHVGRLADLNIEVAGPGLERRPLPASWLYRPNGEYRYDGS